LLITEATLTNLQNVVQQSIQEIVALINEIYVGQLWSGPQSALKKGIPNEMGPTEKVKAQTWRPAN